MAEVEATDGGAVDMRVGDEVVLRVAENGTTGHQWSVEVAGGEVEIVDNGPVPPGDLDTGRPAPGAAGKRLIRVRAVGAGTTVVTLRLARPWEAAVAEERRVEFTVAGLP